MSACTNNCDVQIVMDGLKIDLDIISKIAMTQKYFERDQVGIKWEGEDSSISREDSVGSGED